MEVFNMKKIITLLFIFLITIFNLFSEKVSYKTIENCFSIKEGAPLYADSSFNCELNSYEKYNEGCLLKFILDDRTKIFGNTKTGYNKNDIIASIRIFNSDGEYRKYSLDYIKLLEFDNLPRFVTDKSKNHPKTGLLLLPKKYYDVLNENSSSKLLEVESYWKKDFYSNINNNRYDSWTEIFYPTSLFISNSYICFSRSDCNQERELHEISGLITSIKRINSNNYRIEFYNSISDNYSYAVDETFNMLNSKNFHFFLLEYDGDYINIFLDSDNYLVDKFVISSDEVRTKILELAKNGETSTSNIIWPRHADGSCDYDRSKKTVASQAQKATSPTNVAPNKTMLVSENLKLRSGEATSTQVLTVMQAGTKVKILELGKSETIDGINSNWVKVEVLSGAKDRDGKLIKTGTIGWCYGGYLK